MSWHWEKEEKELFEDFEKLFTSIVVLAQQVRERHVALDVDCLGNVLTWWAFIYTK